MWDVDTISRATRTAGSRANQADQPSALATVPVRVDMARASIGVVQPATMARTTLNRGASRPLGGATLAAWTSLCRRSNWAQTACGFRRSGRSRLGAWPLLVPLALGGGCVTFDIGDSCSLGVSRGSGCYQHRRPHFVWFPVARVDHSR